MREILFRGKRLDNGEWVEGYLGQDTIIGYGETWLGYVIKPVPKKVWDSDWFEVDPSTVCQYTGLKDKNGERIFEGDILEGADYTPEDGGYGVVCFDDGAFEVSGNNCVGTFHENYWGREFEVIGNIHDNPELLKGGEG